MNIQASSLLQSVGIQRERNERVEKITAREWLFTPDQYANAGMWWSVRWPNDYQYGVMTVQPEDCEQI